MELATIGNVRGPASVPSVSSTLIGVTGPSPGSPKHDVILEDELRVEQSARLLGVKE